MKQLKVVVNDEQSLAIAAQGGYVTANFVTPIEVKAGSLICLDKFNATSKNISQNFTVVGQTFTGIINMGLSLANGEGTVTIPGGSYPTVLSYMATINNLANANLLTASTNTLPAGEIPPFVDNTWTAKQNQLGVGLELTQDSLFSKWTCHNYGLSPFSTTPSSFWTPSANLTITVGGLFKPTDGLQATLVSGVVMFGGGLATIVTIDLSDTTDAFFYYGFSSSNGAKQGGKLLQKPGSVNLSVVNDAGQETDIVNSQALFPAAYAGSADARFVIFQKGGKFGFSYCDDITDDNAPVTEYCITGAYAGKMGTWNYSEQYTVVLDYPIGDLSPECVGAASYTPETGGTYEEPFESQSSCNLNLTTAGQLALVLGFEPKNYYFGPLDPETTYIESQSPFNINQLRSAFELGIEILDIPLKTYFAQTQNSQFAGAGGRQNVICYFTPTPSIETEGLYSFANSVHQWLEIDNKSSTYLHSLSFRVFNPYSGLSFISNSMGFNLLISEPDARGLTIGL